MALRKDPIRVLVVEDSPTIRDLLVAILTQAGDMQVVGTALNGEEAVRRAVRLRPDVVTMDIHMPRLDGLEATRRIMREAPTRIVIVTASNIHPDIDLSFESLRAGALTVVSKPALNDLEACERLVQTVRLMADVPVVHHWNSRATTSKTAAAAPPPSLNTTGFKLTEADCQNRKVIGIASSTGGPSALAAALKTLPASYPLPILIVQHITKGFADSLADWLQGQLRLKVKTAANGDILTPATVLLAPDDYHLEVGERGNIILNHDAPYKGLRPSANYLFNSLAKYYGTQSVGIIMTGMGDDGVEGLSKLHQRGGLILAQDESSCVVYGMPREAVLRNAVDYILPPERIAEVLLQLTYQDKG